MTPFPIYPEKFQLGYNNVFCLGAFSHPNTVRTHVQSDILHY